MFCELTMALNFGDEETEKLAAEVARLAGEGEGEAVRQALLERRDRLRAEPREKGRRTRTKEEMLYFMETEIWPLLPARNRGGPPSAKRKRKRSSTGRRGFD